MTQGITGRPSCQSALSRGGRDVEGDKELHVLCQGEESLETMKTCVCVKSVCLHCVMCEECVESDLTVVSVKGWFSNEETPGQLRTIY